MGLFSFVGKVLKGVSKVASFIPGIGGTVSKVTGAVGNLLDHKQPMATAALKSQTIARAGPTSSMGTTPWGGVNIYGGKGVTTPAVLRASPVLPGGAVATSSGTAPRMSNPPATLRSRSAPKRRKAAAKKRKSSTKRRSTRKRLKFGSAAYRKKYLGHR